jgi:lysyl-tRNA synthetase class I
MSDETNENNPLVLTEESKKAMFDVISELTHHLRNIDDEKDRMKEILEDAEGDFGIKKKYFSKMARVMYSEKFETLQQENSHFESLYEIIIGESKLKGD